MLDEAELDADEDPVPAPTDDADDNIMSMLCNFTIFHAPNNWRPKSSLIIRFLNQMAGKNKNLSKSVDTTLD
jgi:hypothetical protein